MNFYYFQKIKGVASNILEHIYNKSANYLNIIYYNATYELNPARVQFKQLLLHDSTNL